MQADNFSLNVGLNVVVAPPSRRRRRPAASKRPKTVQVSPCTGNLNIYHQVESVGRKSGTRGYTCAYVRACTLEHIQAENTHTHT